jgi:hypothetical protein
MMSYWAQLDKDNKVLQVIVGDDDLEDAFQWLVLNHGGVWKLMTENNYGGIGWTYIDDLGFHAPQPFESWTLNGLIWEAPEPKPQGDFYWDEAQLKWVAYELS